MSDKCPKCGAGKLSGFSRFTWACGSISGGHSKRCKDRQIAALTARVGVLEMGVARENQLLKAAVKDYNRVCAQLAAVMEWRHGNHKKFSTLDRILAAKEVGRE